MNHSSIDTIRITNFCINIWADAEPIRQSNSNEFCCIRSSWHVEFGQWVLYRTAFATLFPQFPHCAPVLEREFGAICSFQRFHHSKKVQNKQHKNGAHYKYVRFVFCFCSIEESVASTVHTNVSQCLAEFLFSF